MAWMSKRGTTSEKLASPLAPEGVSHRTLLLLAGGGLIIVAVLISYLPAVSGGFLLDDDLLLTANPLIKASDGLYWFWCSAKAPDYWPVANTSLWIEWRVWGLNPTGYHATNLILHIVAALLLWAILHKLCIPGAFFAALIFAVHPVNVESVAWIAQRKGMLAMAFGLLSVLWYLEYLARARLRLAAKQPLPSAHCPPTPAHSPLATGHWPLFYCLSLAAFILAMLSKGSMAVLPLVLLGIVLWQKGTERDSPIVSTQKLGQSLLPLIPFFLVAGVLSVVNIWFQTHGKDVVTRNAHLLERLLGAGAVVWFYLYKAILPVDLSFIYTRWDIEPKDPLWWMPLAGAVILSVVLWRYRKGWSRPFLFAWGFFCVSLVPVVGFIDVGFMKFSLVADHYQHLAIIGLIVLCAAGWARWNERVGGTAHWAPKSVAVLTFASLALLTWQQSGLYRDVFALYRATLEKNPNCALAHNNLGLALANAGETSKARKHYVQALRLKPEYADAHVNFGVLLEKSGNIHDAIEEYEQAVWLNPDASKAGFNLALAHAKLNQSAEAIKAAKKALRRARKGRQTEQAKQIEEWLKTYRPGRAKQKPD